MALKNIEAFIEAYTREFDYYDAAAETCANQCETLLARQGVRAIVSHRAKRPSKLRSKLKQRDLKKKYQSNEQIREDIPDLAGVRIALYFPADRERVRTMINNNFSVETTKKFPEGNKKKRGKRFDGYHADHYRVQLRDVAPNETQNSYSAAKIEIQVGSVLMHAWAEVEHDLIYKPESGVPSEDENAILDELNGLVIAGEIALERLQRAVERRLSQKTDTVFQNHYELAVFLDEWSRKEFAGEEPPQMGRADILWNLLKRASMNRSAEIEPLLANLANDSTISDQLSEAVLATHPDLYRVFVSLQSNPMLSSTAGMRSSDMQSEAIGKFLSTWIVIESTFTHLVVGDPSRPRRPTMNSALDLAKKIGLSSSSQNIIDQARRTRNFLVHGVEVPSADFLNSETHFLELVILELQQHPDPIVRAAVEEAGKPFDR